VGELFFISKRIKGIRNSRQYRSFYFWRTTMQQEIDLIEESGGQFSAYEIKYKVRKTPKVSKTFSTAYPQKATT
jgi:hypothetical protein